MSSDWSQLARDLAQRRTAHLYRSRRVVNSAQGAVLRIGDRTLVNFSSNDYLGLANHPQVVAALCDGARDFGAGSGAAHLITGHSAAHHALEEELAAFVQRPRALLFSTGYTANVGVIAALTGRGDAVFEDRLNHASLLDGALLAGARLQRFAHADPAALEARLHDSTAARKLIVTDGVFSMDGDVAPVAALNAVAQRHDAWLMVDDAHGLGVIGTHGRGTLEHSSVDPASVPILVGTLGKAFGTFGAFVAGDDDLIEYLIQTARSYIYTTALPPAVAHATRASLRLVQEESWRREKLQALIGFFRAGAQQRRITLADSVTPIQPLIVGTSQRALEISDALYARGILVGAIRPPTVPEGSARLRITLSAAHDDVHVEQLLDALRALL
jgi:8-amino-7-oxononanoate synthase